MKNKLPIIITFIIVGFLVYAFFSLFESYEKEQDFGWDKKALRNPYLAAEQFLIKNKINVSSSNDFEKLTHLPQHGMIFISDARKVLTKKRFKNIMDWMEQGGHLIITAPIYNKNKPNILLSRFKVKNRKTEKPDEAEPAEDEKEKKLSERLSDINDEIKNKEKDSIQENRIPDDKISYLSFTGFKKKLKINFSSESYLWHPYFNTDDDYKRTSQDPTYWAGNEYGTYFMQFSVGEGLVSVITDKTIWDSHNIDKLDHAYLLWVLSKGNPEVLLLYGANTPSIFYFIWEYSSELVLTFLLWLLAWLVYRSRRFGKIYDDIETKNLSISEHIKASAEYLWRNDKYEQLIEPVRSDIFHRANRLFPSFHSLEKKEQVKLISEHSKIDLDKVGIALTRPLNGTENEFTDIISYLQKIRIAL